MAACPWCEAELEGLGRFCHACGRYADDQPQPDKESASPADLRAQTKSEPAAPGGRQVLVLPLPLSANRMWRSSAGARKGLVDAAVRYSKGQASWREVLGELYVNVTVPAEGKQYKADAATWLQAQPTTKIEGPVRLQVTVYFGRRTGDLDNKIKTLLDVLQGVLYEDDSQVAELHILKRHDKEWPRAVVVAEPDDGSTQLDPGATFNYALEF